MPQDIAQLGTILPVNIRTVWEHEGLHFTPWLARPDNLALVANALQLGSLMLEGMEVRVGEFFADIVARDEQDNLVVIENQFGNSDHDHLGKALTYLAGVAKAKKLVWIAERVREPHRAVIDWMNANTPEDVAFFGVEIELLRIDASRPAPRFNVVCKPNNWSRRAARQAASGDWTEDKKWYFAYWVGVCGSAGGQAGGALDAGHPDEHVVGREHGTYRLSPLCQRASERPRGPCGAGGGGERGTGGIPAAHRAPCRYRA